MSTKAALIPDALLIRVATMTIGSPPLPIAMPEQATTFAPPTDGKYLEVRYFTNQAAWEGLSTGVLDQGLLQVTVVWPKNKGLIAPLEAAGLVAAHMPKGLLLFHAGAKIKINREPRIAAPLIEDTEVRVPVVFSWVA
jgi:hypothetical protein